jgi:hypothetical protein
VPFAQRRAANTTVPCVLCPALQKLDTLTRQLTGSGLAPATPAVAVERGTTAQRRVVYGPIEQLHGRATQAGLRTPTLIIIGEVGWGGAAVGGVGCEVERGLRRMFVSSAGAGGRAGPGQGRGGGAGRQPGRDNATRSR